MGVPAHKATTNAIVWKAQDVLHKAELHPVWVHVEGVPYTVKHFHGLWVVGTLIGVTLDVDLVTLQSRGFVHVLVAMEKPKALEKQVDGSCPLLVVACALKPKIFYLLFHREPADFVPFFWRRKGEDGDEEDLANDKNHGVSGPSGTSNSEASNMDVDASHSPTLVNKGKFVVVSPLLCITPYNANLSTPRGMEIVDMVQRLSPQLVHPAVPPGTSETRVERMTVGLLAQHTLSHVAFSSVGDFRP
jgi:hypothetical protein